MFGWFKPKRKDPLERLVDSMFDSLALVGAIAQSVREYVDGVKRGEIEYPAHRRKSPSLAQTWNDVRLEALHKMFGFGQSDPFLLSDKRRERELLTSLLEDRAHLQLPQPTGEPITDTIQGVWQVYVYLDAVGSEVMDISTDRATLSAKGLDIFDRFEGGARAIQGEWESLAASSSQTFPKSLIDVLWEDVTEKCKSIALTTRFGPNPEAGMTYMLGEIAKHGTASDIASTKAMLERARVAKQPEDILGVSTNVGR